jgi:hypothetical protein
MELIEQIEKKGLEVLDELRFPIQFLEIFYEGIWKKIPILGSYKSPFKLEMVLFDTGNIAPYCEISDIYLTSFKNEFPGIEYFPRNYKTLTEELLFRFNSIVEFKSQMGFTKNTPNTRAWRDRININFNSITQFLSIICTSNSTVKNRIFYIAQSLDNLVDFD